jgi:hypothetical protein
MPIEEAWFPLTERQAFLVSKSKSLLHELEEHAFENGLCIVEKITPTRIKIRGLHVQDTMQRMLTAFDHAIRSGHVISTTRPYSERIIAVIGETEKRNIAATDDIRIEVNEESITVLAVTSSKFEVRIVYPRHIASTRYLRRLIFGLIERTITSLSIAPVVWTNETLTKASRVKTAISSVR